MNSRRAVQSRGTARFRPVVAVIALSSLALVAGACGSSGSTSASSTTAAANATGSTATGDTAAGSNAAGSPDDPSDSTPAGDVASVEVVPDMGTGDVTVTWGKDSAFDPTEATVKVGQVVEFVSGEGAPISGIGLAENGHDSRTLTTGMSVSYKFTKAGTFTFYEQINGKTFVVTVTS